MAKLSARGRKELVRVAKEASVPLKVSHLLCDGGGCPDCGGTGEVKSLISWESVTLALMTDRKVLRKRVVVFREDNRRHDYGWTVDGAIKEGVTPDKFKAVFLKAGYTEV